MIIFQNIPVKTCPDLDIKHFKHLSCCTALDESTVDFKASNNLFTSFCWSKIHFLTLNRIILPRSGVDVEQVLDLGHQNFSSCIQPFGNRIVKRIFESFLLTVHGREKIGLVKVMGLEGPHESGCPLNSQMGAYHFSFEVNLHHTANRIADMNQLEETKQWSNNSLRIL